MVDLSAYPQGLQDLEALGEVVVLPAHQELLAERIGEFDGFVTPITVETNRNVLATAPRLQVIATASTGIDHIDVAQAERQNIAVLTLRGETDLLNKITATAEMAWALLLATARKLPAAVADVNRGSWKRENFRGTQLSGKVLGIFGYGRLGKMVAEYGKAFGMNVLACDHLPVKTPSAVTQVDFDTLLEQADVISIHVHLSDDTRHQFDSSAFRKMKQGAMLINTSRGAIIEESALLAALESGHLAGAGLDVIDGERGAALHEHPFIQYASTHDNLVISPHMGGATFESQALALERILQKLRDFFDRRGDEEIPN